MIGKTALVITSFCMDADNNLVVCSGGKSQKQGIAAAIAQSVFGGDQRGRVSRFSSDRKQLGSCDLEFVPTAIDIASDGTIFVAGNGVVAKISHDLKLIKSAESPHIEDLEARNAQVLEEFRAEEKENERRLEELKKSIELPSLI